MSVYCRSIFAVLATGALSVAAHATVVPYVGAQGPKPDLTAAAPPPLLADITAARNSFSNLVNTLGTAEFEYTGAAISPFDYAGGTMTISGGAIKVDGNVLTDLTLGRYNMSPAPLGEEGHWLESQSDFSLAFTGTAVTAFSFFATDLGDYDGTVDVEIFGGSDGRRLFSRRLENSSGVVTDADGERITAGANGNLLYFGVTSSSADDYFTSVRFTINPGGNGDRVGFDSLVIGQYNGPTTPTIPEPGSLALAGLALFAAGYARKARKAA